MSVVLALPARIDVTTVGGVFAALVANRGDDLDLNGAAVERIGGLGLQLIVSANRSWREDGRTLRLVEPSAPLRSSLERLGFSLSDLACAEIS